MKIQAGKQVGPIYYMVKDAEVLENIVRQGVIRTSLKVEPVSKGGESKHYISFMRDLTKADRNPNRWVYGIQLDGDRLSDRYKINPYSYAGNNVRAGSNFYRIKTLTAYDNNTYKLNLVNWPPISIPKEIFDDLKDAIHRDPEGNNDVKNLEVSHGKRRIKGRLITVKYNYNTKHGGFKLNEDTVSNRVLSYLLKHTSMNETEERIWIFDDSVRYINIARYITGYIEPKGDDAIEQKIDDGLIPPLKILYY